jgi:hypothetical protein
MYYCRTPEFIGMLYLCKVPIEEFTLNRIAHGAYKGIRDTIEERALTSDSLSIIK